MMELFGSFEAIVPRITSDLLNDAAAYWDSLRDGKPLPGRSAVDPMKIPRLLPTIFIVIVEPAGGFRYQLAGSLIEERYKRGSMKDKTPEDIAGHAAAENILRPYRRVRDERVLFYREATLEWISAAQKFTHYKALLMPLGEDGETVDMILGVHDFVRAELD